MISMTDVLPEKSLAWLLITTIVALFTSVLSSIAIYRLVKRREMQDSINADLEKNKKERIRLEVTKWTPILWAVRDLEKILKNILELDGWVALSENYKEKTNINWAITYDYMMYSSLYLFAQYFYWIRLLKEEINLELFTLEKKETEFFEAVDEMMKSLDNFPPNYGATDWQVFELQQRAIAEIMSSDSTNGKKCISYPEFKEKIDNDRNFAATIEPLKKLLKDLIPDKKLDLESPNSEKYVDGRWERLNSTFSALSMLRVICEKTWKVNN
jgi:hypothetical protein